MTQVNMLEAKTQLTKLIKTLETKQEDEIIIARDGKPIASIKLINNKNDRSKLFGCGKGIIKHHDLDLDEFNSLNEEIAREFEGDF